VQLGSNEAIKQATADGLGLACLSLCAVEELLTPKRLALVNNTLPRLIRRFYRTHQGQNQFSAGQLHFVGQCETV